MPPPYWRSVEKYGLTFLIGAPATLKALHDDTTEDGLCDLGKLKGIVTMGAPLERI